MGARQLEVADTSSGARTEVRAVTSAAFLEARILRKPVKKVFADVAGVQVNDKIQKSRREWWYYSQSSRDFM